MNYKTCWITLNRECNLRCEWCYAKETGYMKKSNMELKTAFEIIDICSDLNIRHITLIGGEPTLYPYLFDVIRYSSDKNIKCGFVSNGLKYSDNSFLQKLISHGIKNFSISLKGENSDVFKKITGKDSFSDVISGIRNCISNNVSVNISMVLTEDNIDSYIEGIEFMKSIGVNNFHFSFCYEFDMLGKKQFTNNPKYIIEKFMQGYQKLDNVTEHKFKLSQSYPMCLWKKDFIDMLHSKKQIVSVCQLLSKSGLLFDTEANIIPCNAMYKIKLGKLHDDFNNAKELMLHTQKKEFKDVYAKLCGVPSKQCLECADLKVCGGGCVCQWTNYSYEQLISM